MGLGNSHHQIQFFLFMVGQQLASKPTFTEEVEKLNPSATCNMLLEASPPVFPIDKRELKELQRLLAIYKC